MNPMIIALMFVLAMALPAFAAVKYSVKTRKQLAYAYQPVRRHFTSSTEGSIVLPVRASATEAAPVKLRLLGRAPKQQIVDFEDGEVNAVIDKLILTAPSQNFKKLS